MTSRIHRTCLERPQAREPRRGVDGLKNFPSTAEVQTLTADAQAQAEAAGYDVNSSTL